jgi:hypothetical protein
VKELRDDDPFFIRDVDAGKGDTFEYRVFAPDLVVQDSVSTNDFGVDVGEQAIGNILLFAELAQDFLIVVRDRIDLDTGGLEFLERVAQLTELRPTRRSPNRRSIENDDRFGVASTVVIVDELSVRVGQLEIGKSFADLRTRRMSVRQTCPSGMAERRGGIKTMMVAFYRHAPSWDQNQASVLTLIVSILDVLIWREPQRQLRYGRISGRRVRGVDIRSEPSRSIPFGYWRKRAPAD